MFKTSPSKFLQYQRQILDSPVPSLSGPQITCFPCHALVFTFYPFRAPTPPHPRLSLGLSNKVDLLCLTFVNSTHGGLHFLCLVLYDFFFTRHTFLMCFRLLSASHNRWYRTFTVLLFNQGRSNLTQAPSTNILIQQDDTCQKITLLPLPFIIFRTINFVYTNAAGSTETKTAL